MAAPSESDNLVTVRALGFRRGERIIFDNVDLYIRRGAITAIMGPSGSGKTTLLKLIAGQLRPATGEVLFDGKAVHRMGTEALYRLRKRLGMLFQSGALFTDLSVFDNVAFPLREHTRLPERLIRRLVLMKLQCVGLRGARDLMPAELSGGMARRVALARAIALDPEMIMYDEPFAGQDPISMGVLVKLIRLLNDSLGLTSVIVSHDIHETATIADYIYLIAEGRVVAEGTPEVLRDSQSPWADQFLHALPDGPVPFHYPAADYVAELLAGAGR